MLDWAELENACFQCEKCELSKTRKNVVFGIGPHPANVMLVGEGPGEQEDLLAEPFVGPAGKLLDDMLSIICLSRKNSYIGNIVKCRPPYNRDPRDEEQDFCVEYLYNQIFHIRPKIIVCLGRIAAKRLISPDFRITKDHGNWIQKDGIWITATYHPSALLRDPSKRPDSFEDLLRIRDKMRELGIAPERL